MARDKFACLTLLTSLSITASTTVTPHQQYAFSPTFRTVKPNSIFQTTGNVTSIPTYGPDTFQLTGPNASVTFDFGQEIAGQPTLTFHNSDCGAFGCSADGLPSLSCSLFCQGLGISYSESIQYIGPSSDQSTLYSIPDGTVFLPLLSNGSYEVPSKWSRGGFRYLTLSLNDQIPATTSTAVSLESIYFNAAPNLPDGQLDSYTGYFHSSDELLNSICYAGAYTLQLCSIAANTSVNHVYAATGSGWSQDATATGLTSNDVFLVDGAKRDRNAWAGDLSIGLRSALVAQNYGTLIAVRNTLQACIALQDMTLLSSTYGYFPYAGSPLGDLLKIVPVIPPYGSDTYHLYTMDAFVEYAFISNDTTFVQQYWNQINTGIRATYDFVQDDGLFNSTRTNDWGRVGQGGKNTALNALYYKTLRNLAILVTVYPSITPGADADRWISMADKIKSALNDQLWDQSAGLYRDNTTAAGAMVHPQDGNAFTVEFGLTDSASKDSSITSKLAQRLTPYGAPSAELPGSISPYITSHELIAQFAVAEATGNASYPIELTRTQWGYMQRAFSKASFIEGYAANGSLNYGFYTGAPSFISHAHAWSTGPTYSLVHDVVGIRATRIEVSLEDGDWAIKPVIAGSGLTSAEGGVNVLIGKLDVSWTIQETPRRFELNVSAPEGTEGTIYVPTFSCNPSTAQLHVDEQLVPLPPTQGPFFGLEKMKGGHTKIVLEF